MDIRAAVDGSVMIQVGDRRLIPTGLCVEIPLDYEGQIRARSGLALNYGVQVHLGTIDRDYRGEIRILVFNFGDKPFGITRGDRVAQLVIAPVVRARIVEVDELGGTARGDGGFGSTG